jgi:hypothetical protein
MSKMHVHRQTLMEAERASPMWDADNIDVWSDFFQQSR